MNKESLYTTGKKLTGKYGTIVYIMSVFDLEPSGNNNNKNNNNYYNNRNDNNDYITITKTIMNIAIIL